MAIDLAAIAFPLIDPVAFHVGPLAVRWYGLAYLATFAVGYFILRSLARRGRMPIPLSQVANLVPWLIAGVMLGGRAGWWIFYHRPDGMPDAWYEPLAVWHGGMSFHGGLIGVIIALAFWCWRNHAPFWAVADVLAVVAPIGLFLGRIANFVNAELVGRPTSLPWGVVFPGDIVARHPSQLYEALLEGPVLLIILVMAFRHHRRSGTVAALFLVIYGLFRIAVEFVRQPDEQIGFLAFGCLTMGQVLSAALVVIGVTRLVFEKAASHDLIFLRGSRTSAAQRSRRRPASADFVAPVH